MASSAISLSIGRFDLATVVKHFAPSVLVGVSGQAGTFTEAIIGDLVRGCPRPIVLALSNPNSRIEATPADLIRWTNGAAVVGTGGPFGPVVHNGTTHTIGQGNNVFIFPGVGLGATAVGAQWLPDDAFSAAADALVECTSARDGPGGAIYPPLSDLRRISREVGLAVARTLVSLGAAPSLPDDEIRRRVLAGIWEPAYLPYRAG
jgi:malate dehydrogenase (oxaloacetate-decarboxylating)